MQIGRVIGNIVATKKNLKLDGEKLLLVQPLDLAGASKGPPIIAIDRMGAGPKERLPCNCRREKATRLNSSLSSGKISTLKVDGRWIRLNARPRVMASWIMTGSA